MDTGGGVAATATPFTPLTGNGPTGKAGSLLECANVLKVCQGELAWLLDAMGGYLGLPLEWKRLLARCVAALGAARPQLRFGAVAISGSSVIYSADRRAAKRKGRRKRDRTYDTMLQRVARSLPSGKLQMHSHAAIGKLPYLFFILQLSHLPPAR